MSKKGNILLDLDQTVISAEPTEELDMKKFGKKSKKFEMHQMEDIYKVYSRPHLQEFLDYIFKNFNVSVWTAASKDYALFIIEKMLLQNKSDRKLDLIMFSYHCDWSRKCKKTSKDLSMLWDIHKLDRYNKNNTVIVDDYVEDVYEPQPKNCIIAPPFEFTQKGSENDTFLKDLVPHLEKLLKTINDHVETDENEHIDLTKEINIAMKTN